MPFDDRDAKTIILDTSILLFSTHGYRETSIREISKKAGVNVSMISYYFGSKDGILRDIVKNITKEFTVLLSKFDFGELSFKSIF